MVSFYGIYTIENSICPKDMQRFAGFKTLLVEEKEMVVVTLMLGVFFFGFFIQMLRTLPHSHSVLTQKKTVANNTIVQKNSKSKNKNLSNSILQNVQPSKLSDNPTPKISVSPTSTPNALQLSDSNGQNSNPQNQTQNENITPVFSPTP